MKKYLNKILLAGLVLATMSACDVEEFGDLNNPEASGFEAGISRGDLRDLVGGVLYAQKVRLGTYYDDVGVIGREFYRFSSSDPRLTQDLLGGGNSTLDNNTFYTTGPWAARYRTVKNANLILGFLENPVNVGIFTTAEISATRGFLQTVIANELLLNLNLTDVNGIRVDVADENNLGPVLDKAGSLTAIRTLLDTANTNLLAGGDAFPFALTSGFAGFDTPSSFATVNRAFTARVAAYQEDYSGVLNLLGSSFMDRTSGSDLTAGIYYTFTEDATDLINPVFFPINATSAGARVAHPSVTDDAEANDNRLDDVAMRDDAITFDGLTGSFAFWRYKSRTAAIPIIRNEELILLYAEAQIFNNPGEAVNTLNDIRSRAGVGAYPGNPADTNDLVDDMLRQRRYSLYGEGHRWIDGRRYNILDDATEFPIDRIDEEGNPDNVWSNFPIPLNENAG